MLRVASLTVLGILCVSQDVPLRFRIDRKTDSVKHGEHSSSNQDSSHFSSLPHSRSDHRVSKDKQRLHLHSKFSRNEFVKWDETENDPAEESGKRFERQVKKDERRYYVEWTPQTTSSRRSAMRRRAEALHSGTSSYTPQRERPNSVDDISKKQRTRKRRSPIKNNLSKALHDHKIRNRALRKSQSSAAGLNAERSKTRSRKSWIAADDNQYENFNSKKRLNRRQLEEEDDTDVSYDDDDTLADEDELKDEGGEVEESVQKRNSDEVMISRAVLIAMGERILARVKDFINKNTQNMKLDPSAVA